MSTTRFIDTLRRGATSGLVLLSAACASVQTEGVVLRGRAGDAIQAEADPAARQGPRRRVQVLRFGIPKEIADAYPELVDRRVGWGLGNRVLEGLYDTGRFDFVEEKDAILEKMVGQWKLSEAGVVSEQTRVDPGSLTAPEFLVYAEVYEFAVARAEELTGISSEKRNSTVIGVQIRVVDVRTGEYVVASASGDATTTANGVWLNPALPFDQSTVGIATRRAVNVALDRLLRRMAERRLL